jgi:hypothetical protein
MFLFHYLTVIRKVEALLLANAITFIYFEVSDREKESFPFIYSTKKYFYSFDVIVTLWISNINKTHIRMYYILRKWIPILDLSVQWIPHKLIWFTNLLILINNRWESPLFSSDLYLIFMKVFKINYWPNLWLHKSFWFLWILNSQLIIKNDLFDNILLKLIFCLIYR